MSDTIVRGLTQIAGTSETTSTSLAAFRPRDREATYAGKLRGEARLARLKQAIVEGAYQIDAQRIAGKFLKRS